MNRPARVVDVDQDGASAIVESGGARREVSLVVLTYEGVPVRRGDWLLLGAGLAVARIDEQEATEMLELLRDAR